MKLYKLTCNMVVGDSSDFIEELSDVTIALCTSVQEAKRIAQTLTSVPIQWEALDDGRPVDEDTWHVADVSIEGTDGWYTTPVKVNQFWITDGALDKLLRHEWPRALNKASQHDPV